ncbi:MAG: PadR family transcriptional regulator [Nitrososphaerota archaeon]|nr:PadR family transcriptional regulator [Nitrososphaerota archaeon]
MFAPSRARGVGWVRRGDARLLVLEVLKERPMHGYEVGKAIAQLFGGAYEPSPGVVYPNLQWLEDEGMLEPLQRNGKKVYKVTEKGRKFAAQGRVELLRLLEIGRGTSKGAKWALITEGRQLTRELALAFPDLAEAKARKLVMVLHEAREKVERVLEQ